MSFKDFFQNVQMYGTYVKTTTFLKWSIVTILVTFYFIYVIGKLITLWITIF